MYIIAYYGVNWAASNHFCKWYSDIDFIKCMWYVESFLYAVKGYEFCPVMSYMLRWKVQKRTLKKYIN